MVVLCSEGRAELAAPSGQILLTVSGQIKQTNVADHAEFDRAMLEGFGLVALKTWTPWTDGEPVFTGLPLAQVLASVAPEGTSVRAIAANDYIADIPIDVIEQTNAFLAMSMDGRTLTLRDKGPLWIIFPWSQQPDLDNTQFYNYAVWQLRSLQVQ